MSRSIVDIHLRYRWNSSRIQF